MHNLERNACTIQPERMHNDLRSACTFPAAYAKKPAVTAAPLPRGTKVSSKAFGIGTILSTSKDGVVSVRFDSKEVRFVYPDAFKQGFLAAV